MSMELKSRWSSAVGATAGAGALLFTFACGGTARELTSVSAAAPGAAGAPVLVSCEPHQRTLVRPVVVNGAVVSQVECVAAVSAAYAQNVAAAPQPVAYGTAAYPAAVAQPVYAPLGDAQVVPASYPAPVGAARPVRTRQVVQGDYERPVKRTRSVKKSAIIIGSSAGVGAGVGAAVGGKKGALIGAAIWDQVTRRK